MTDTILNFIDGKLLPSRSGDTLDVYNPSTGKVYATAPASGKEDVDHAVDAAKKAFPGWTSTSTHDRYTLLLKIASRIESKLEELAEAESKDNGKPVWLAKKVDIPRASENFRFFANAITQFSSEAHDMDGKAINYTLRQPLGVVGCISPWNLPLYLFTWKIAPALATGNTVVAKPSEITPMTAFLLAKICQEVGLPDGVLNIIHGLGADVGAAISQHKDIKAISFTGSTITGAAIAATAAPLFKKLSLEMGGKNPAIIFADCNYDKMLKTVIASSFSNQGQICLCGSRILVEDSIYERFKKDFVEKTQRLKVGPPNAKETKIGAVVSKPHMDKILSYITLAKEEGGKILCGGTRIHLEGEFEEGWYIQPTIIEGLAYDCRVNMEEIFGPVVTIMPFSFDEQAIMYANSTQYGLSATLWTENLTRAHSMARTIDAGIVWINTWLLRDLRTPFGGMKNSGVGREGGLDALRFFTESKNICIEING